MSKFYKRNNSVVAELNSYRSEMFNDKKCFSFSLLNKEYQDKIIADFQNGNENLFEFIYRGFWGLVSARYLSTVGTLSYDKIHLPLIWENLNDIGQKINYLAKRNNFELPLGVQVAKNIQFMCLTFRKKHEFGFRVNKDQSDENIKNLLYSKNTKISINDLDETQINETETINTDFDQKLISDYIFNYIQVILNDIYPFESDIRKSIINIWLQSVINSYEYSFAEIGIFYGYNYETIRKIIRKFKIDLMNSSHHEGLFSLLKA